MFCHADSYTLFSAQREDSCLSYGHFAVAMVMVEVAVDGVVAIDVVVDILVVVADVVAIDAIVDVAVGVEVVDG